MAVSAIRGSAWTVELAQSGAKAVSKLKLAAKVPMPANSASQRPRLDVTEYRSLTIAMPSE
jgi:hypothetical protein